MLRVVDVKRALESRGYSIATRGKVEMDFRDDVVVENNGRWSAEFADGRARLKKIGAAGAGRSGVSCGIRGLAAMYSGLYSPRQAAAIGLCSGDEKSLDVLGGAFASGTPWMSDHY